MVVGSAASGTDIAYFVSKVATKTTISYHDATKVIPNGIYKKSDIKEFTENGVIFVDGTQEDFSVVIFATGDFWFHSVFYMNFKKSIRNVGYLYSFPFLSMDCGIIIEDNYVQPLFKHCININYPTMCFIGIPYLVHPPLISYLQVEKYFFVETGR